eukprot:gene11993-13229_t
MNETNTSLTCYGLRHVDFRLTTSVKSSAIISTYVSVTTSFTTTLFSSGILYILAKNSELHRPVNILIGMLCLSDLLNSLIAQPLNAILRIQELGNIHMCDLKTGTSMSAYFCIGISAFHIIIISIHRFTRISRLTQLPNVGHQDSFKKFKVALAFVWIFWALLVGLSAVKIVPRVILNIICTTIIIGSVVIIIYSYMRLKRVYRISPKLNSALSQQTLERRRKQNLYQLNTNLFILLSFIISYLPRVVCFANEAFNAKYSFSAMYVCGRFANAVTHVTTMLHPIIYCWRVASFRNKITPLLTGIVARFR